MANPSTDEARLAGPDYYAADVDNFDDSDQYDDDEEAYFSVYQGSCSLESLGKEAFLTSGKTFQPRSLDRYSQNLDLDGYYEGPKLSGNALNSYNGKSSVVRNRLSTQLYKREGEYHDSESGPLSVEVLQVSGVLGFQTQFLERFEIFFVKFQGYDLFPV